MNTKKPDAVPEDFERLPTGLGFIDRLQPLYRLLEDENTRFGMLVTAQHCNTMGMCHGGVLMTLADIAATTGANRARGRTTGSPTIHLGVDFIAPARPGEWLDAVAERVNAKRRVGFCSGAIYNSAGVVVRFGGTVYFPDT